MEDVSQGAWGSSARGGCQSAMAAAAVVARTPLLVHRERLVEGNNGVEHDNNGNNDDKKASVHHHRHHQQQHCQHQQQQRHQHHHHHQKQQQEHPGNAYDREEAQDAEGRRDHYFCYLGDSGKSAQHAFKQGGVERALELGEVAVAATAAAAAATAAVVTASDLGGTRDEWLSAVDDSTAMMFEDDDEATIRLELVGATAALSSLSSPLSSLSSPSSSLSSPSVGAAAATTAATAAATIRATTAAIAAASSAAAAAAASAVTEAATTPDQTKGFFLLSPMTGHGHGGDSEADWLADLGVGGEGGVDGGIGFGVGSADEPSCLPSGGDEMLLPPEARPPWEKATTARARFVTCDSVLPLPKPKYQQQAKKKGFAARQRLSSPKKDPANSRQSSTGRPRRGSGLPR